MFYSSQGGSLVTITQSFDRASLAIKYAHEWAESMRFEAIIAKQANSAPAAIYRLKRPGKFTATTAKYSYTIASAWEEKPDGAGNLVMIVSASGIEKLEGPWTTEKEFVWALQA
jgi:hypothetical protein